MTPFPHQFAAIQFFLRARRCLLCHAPGLGKTMTALWALKAANVQEAFVIHPAKVSRQWGEAIHSIFPVDSYFPRVQHCSWDSPKLLGALSRLQPGSAVVEDEIHYLKNADSQRFRRVAPLLHQVVSQYGLMALGLSATPIYSYVADIFSELYALGLVRWEDRPGFLLRYCKPRQGVGGVSFTDANEAALPELKNKLSAYVHLVTWESAGVSMPPVTLEDYPCGLDLGMGEQAEYRRAADDFRGWYSANRGHPAPPMGRFTTLRLLLAKAKVATVFKKLLGELRFQNFKVLLFSSFKEPLRQLKDLCDKAGVSAFLHTGDDSAGERENQLLGYLGHQGSAALLATTKSLGDAKDGLQKAGNRLYLLDLDYDPSSFVQVVGRLRRLGQVNPVAVLRFHVRDDTLEKHIVDNIGRKEGFIRQAGLLNEGMALSSLRSKL